MNETRSPWLLIPLTEYESHMKDVYQLDALSELFGDALERCRPKSVAVLGVAGGNGLERIDCELTTRIVGLDVNRAYLQSAKNRYGYLPGLELHQVDLSADPIMLPPVELVHAALIFEHAGVDRCLENALSLLSPGGHFSVVLQSSYGGQRRGEAPVQAYIHGHPLDFGIVDYAWFGAQLGERGLVLVHERKYPVPTGEFRAAIYRA